MRGRFFALGPGALPLLILFEQAKKTNSLGQHEEEKGEEKQHKVAGRGFEIVEQSPGLGQPKAVLADHLLLECRIAVRRFVGGAVGHVGVLSLVARQLLHLMRHHLAVISGVDGAEGDDVARLHLHPAVGLGDHHVARGKFVLHGIGPHDGKLIAEQPLTLDLVEGGDGNDRKQRRQDGDQRDQHRENPAGDGQGSARGKQRCGLCSLVVVHVAYQTFPGDTASTMLSTPATLSHGMSLWFIIERFSPFVNEGGTGFISAGATR